MNDLDILIVGAGASGLISAITAKEKNRNLRIAVCERMPRVLKKVLATGNGTCNLSNSNINCENYHGDREFFKEIYRKFTLEKTLRFFENIGIVTEADKEGRIYPISRNASAVVDALRLKAQAQGISFVCDFDVTEILRLKDGFLIKSDDKTYTAEKVILACGGTASKNLGSNGSGYRLAEALGHSRTKLFPAICPYKTDTSKIKALKGIRLNAKVTVLAKEKPSGSLTGELLFTEYGLSGNLIFKLSRTISENIKNHPVLSVDLLPTISKNVLISSMYETRADAGYLRLDEFIMGFLPKPVIRAVLCDAKVNSPSRNASSLSDKEINIIADRIKDFRIIPKEPLSFEKAQVTCGGLKTEEFSSETLESNRVKNLFACGEILNIDGDCGGYNLQWAWSSGHTAGLAAAE